MLIRDEKFYLLALQSVEGLGPIKSNALIGHFGSAENIFLAKKKELEVLRNILSPAIVQQVYEKQCFQIAENEFNFCQKNGIDIIFNSDENFPARLKHMVDKPLVLFKKGDIFPKIKKTIAIVGTRKSTEYGYRFLENLFEELKAVKDICVISGLALGIDAKAHTLSVKNKIPTIGVMGLALDTIYPVQNFNLAQSILKEGGGWLTETSSQSKTSQGVFPRRNRIIAGLCDALLVVETDIKGGAVITAHLANDYSKEVFALPGRVSDAQSRGCNDLIQKNIASLVNTPTDIIEAMSWAVPSNKKLSKSIEIDFEGSAAQKSVLNIIRISPKIDFERLVVETNLEHGQLIEALLVLELEGVIHTLPGNKYEII